MRASASLPPRPPIASARSNDDGIGGERSHDRSPSRVSSSFSQAPTQDTSAEGTPLLHSSHASQQFNFDYDDGVSVSSRRSVASALPLSWMLTNLSNTILPGDTELIKRSTYSCDSYDDNDEESIGSGSLDSDEHTPNESGRLNGGYSRSLDSGSHKHHPHHDHKGSQRVYRSVNRRIFLLLTEPSTSIASFIFFIVLILSIFFSNVLMMLQTMPAFQFKPDDCVICGGTNEYYSTNDDAVYTGPPLPDLQNLPIDCECPPVPLPWTVWMEDATIWFFTVEWSLRVLCYEPPTAIRHHHSIKTSLRQKLRQKLSYLLEWTTMLDAFAIFPYYVERYEETNGLLSLRLLRLFRVFQLLRLGKYNSTFMSLMNVLVESVLSFNILLIVLVFGAAFFGSMIYWMEKGEWKYTTYTDPPSFAYMRIGADGVTEEPTPFSSIPTSFWWFIVTASTVGYGDTYPTSFGGKCVAALAMLMGVLVIAFPVSVFSDLWSKELKKAGVLEKLDPDLDCVASGGSGQGPVEVSTDFNVDGQSTVVMRTDDLKAIKFHLHSIDKSRERIREILANYENNPGVDRVD